MIDLQYHLLTLIRQACLFAKGKEMIRKAYVNLFNDEDPEELERLMKGEVGEWASVPFIFELLMTSGLIGLPNVMQRPENNNRFMLDFHLNLTVDKDGFLTLWYNGCKTPVVTFENIMELGLLSDPFNLASSARSLWKQGLLNQGDTTDHLICFLHMQRCMWPDGVISDEHDAPSLLTYNPDAFLSSLEKHRVESIQAIEQGEKMTGDKVIEKIKRNAALHLFTVFATNRELYLKQWDKASPVLRSKLSRLSATNDGGMNIFEVLSMQIDDRMARFKQTYQAIIDQCFERGISTTEVVVTIKPDDKAE